VPTLLFKSFYQLVLRDVGQCPGEKRVFTLNKHCALTKTGSPQGFARIWLHPHCSSWQQTFLFFIFQGVGVCLVCAKHSTFFSGHNSVEHNIFFQKVSGFVTWLLAIPRRDLMLAFFRSSFLGHSPKEATSVKKELMPGQVLPFQHKISSALSVL